MWSAIHRNLYRAEVDVCFGDGKILKVWQSFLEMESYFEGFEEVWKVYIEGDITSKLPSIFWLLSNVNNLPFPSCMLGIN